MSDWARLVRTACPECGSVDLAWTTAIDLPWRVQPDVGPLADPGDRADRRHQDLLAERKRLWQAINFCGPDSTAWICNSCRNWGVFTDTERLYAPAAPGSSFRRRS